MSIMVGSARINEKGTANGGKAGDQKQSASKNDMAGELSIQAMYTNSKGWYIIRPKSIAHANAIASAMKTACDNKHIGYDQSTRYGVIKNGIKTTVDTNADCSSLVRACVIAGTGKDPGDFNTASEKTVLGKSGLFEDAVAYVSQSKTPVYNGDILVTKTKGHTVIVVSGSPRKETTSDVAPVTPVPTDTTVYATVHTNSGKNLCMRNSKGSAVGVIPNGTKIKVVKKSARMMTISGDEYEMCEVIYKNTDIFVAQKYLRF